jgi:hypothetical protein
LQDLAVDGGVFWRRGAQAIEFGFLLIPGDGDTHPSPGDDTLLYGGVVEMVAQAEHTPKFPLLCGSGLELVLIRLADRWLFHTSLFCLIGAKLARARTTG